MTALVANDLLGGDLMVAEVYLEDQMCGYHWWNRLATGLEIDLTREQFQHGEIVTSARSVKRPADPPRYRNSEYLLFRQRVIDKLGELPAEVASMTGHR